MCKKDAHKKTVKRKKCSTQQKIRRSATAKKAAAIRAEEDRQLALSAFGTPHFNEEL